MTFLKNATIMHYAETNEMIEDFHVYGNKQKAPGCIQELFYSYFYKGEGLTPPQAGYQLKFTIQPFADNVADNACYN